MDLIEKYGGGGKHERIVHLSVDNIASNFKNKSFELWIRKRSTNEEPGKKMQELYDLVCSTNPG